MSRHFGGFRAFRGSLRKLETRKVENLASEFFADPRLIYVTGGNRNARSALDVRDTAADRAPSRACHIVSTGHFAGTAYID